MEVPIPQITEETGEEIVDVSVPPVDAIEALQLPVCATSNEIQRKYFDMFSGQEEFLTKIHELRMQLDAHFKTLDVLRVRKTKTRVLDQVENLVAESGRFDPCLFLKEQIVV